ncbi:hypothetical protein [Cohnella thailandensis]|uniref:Uncharacterized protein n=1 Tax=Cohnella thailandensis TaxID=557557 RepID=A0A841T9M2_9BACL|nr:hypothetical protein [Cohnella thailandensis]MBB6637911.1 hypothetical protein [Cohnella thailandensis]MBP1977381.1 hypothetical protein [Cohnella thailandensis]
MPKSRSLTERSLLRRLGIAPNGKASTKAQKNGPAKKRPRAAKVRLHQSGIAEERKPPVRQIPWWVLPEDDRMLTPGGGIPGGLFPPGGGPGVPGPGGPGGPGPGGPGGPGPGPGPGPFPPPPPPRPPGPPPGPPGPFPPPPRPPGPFPLPPPPRPPFPIPIPFPIPVPPPGPTPAFIIVQINGGFAFPGATQTAFAFFFPGITIRQALQSTGLVTFGPRGFISFVSGIRISGTVGVQLRYNGRIIPQTLLDLPAAPFSTIGLELFYF